MPHLGVTTLINSEYSNYGSDTVTRAFRKQIRSYTHLIFCFFNVFCLNFCFNEVSQAAIRLLRRAHHHACISGVKHTVGQRFMALHVPCIALEYKLD